MKHILYICLFLSFVILKTNAIATEDASVWVDIEAPFNSSNKQARNGEQAVRWLMLDDKRLLKQLNSAPDEIFNQKATRQIEVQIALPLPSGKSIVVSVEKSSIMETSLAEKYPQMQTWKVHGVTDKSVSGRLDFTPAGFHAILSLENTDMVFIDPEVFAGNQYYLSKQRPSAHLSANQCQVKHVLSEQQRTVNLQRSLAKSDSSILQTYRLALATTGEYTDFFGGTVEKGLAAVVTTINRVNEIYERDLAIRLILVAENDRIIYTNGFFDPYTNSSSDRSSDQNQINLDNVIGSNNYDIGHVFGTGRGGIAALGVVCQNNKAIGATGLEAPINDAFYIDFVAHEIGHQFGAEHTFNGTKGNCATRNANTAYEPGSGSTIMAYAGICETDNLQKNTDAVFHSASIQQIMYYTRKGKGASCAAIKILNNAQPKADAGNNYTIPARTPFLLSASATDADNDTLTYAWDQMDLGEASAPDIDNGQNAIIRSYLPSKSAQRSIPKLSDLLAGTHTKGEILPTTSRALKFNLVVRDGKGGVATDGIQLKVYDTGSAFAIREPDASTSIKRGQKLSIIWNVANTDVSPISCAKVDIALSTDGGKHFAMLKENAPNDGSEKITIPASAKESNQARLKISCSNNIFFALTPANFSISDTVKEVSKKKNAGGMILPQLLLLLLLLAIRKTGIRRAYSLRSKNKILM
jgi:hypothetical protein